jgi:hypothetical protein
MINILKIIQINILNKMNIGKNIIFLDIDNTLLVPQNIYIYYKRGEIKKTYTPEEYAALNVKTEDKKWYDYSDFRDAKIIRNSIETSMPLEKNLEIVDEFIKNNYELGILTARGQENLIAHIMPKWLKRNVNNKFKKIKRENIHAINDITGKYMGVTDGEKKLSVLIEHVESKKYDNIVFIDDNKYTIDLINEYNKTVKRSKRIQTIFVE